MLYQKFLSRHTSWSFWKHASPLDLIPAEIISQYNLHQIQDNGWIYIEIQNGMYGLPQAKMLVNKILTQQLATRGFYPCQFTPGLWWHACWLISSVLIVDNFGIKYTGLQHAQYLVESLQQNYVLALNWSGTLFCGITLTWDYTKQTVHLLMPVYIAKALAEFQHPPPSHPQHLPCKHNPIKYDVQVPLPKDNSPLLSMAKHNMHRKLWVHYYTTFGLLTPPWHVP